MSDRTIGVDLDGTLTTCEPRQSAVLRAVLAAAGTSADIAEVWRLKRDGATTENALRKLGLAPELTMQVAKRWRQIVEEPVWLGFDSTFAEAVQAVCLMKSADFDPVLVTARSRPEWVNHQVERLGLRRLVSQVLVVHPTSGASAKAAVLTKMCAIAFFGDTEVDARAAAESNVPFYGVASGQRSAAFLSEKCGIVASANLAEAWKKFWETQTGR